MNAPDAMPGPTVPNPIAARAMAERRELTHRAAESVLEDHRCGRYVDPHRLEWARSITHGVLPMLGSLGTGEPR